jgi:hypothetical protein
MDNLTAIAQMLSEEIQQVLTTGYTLTDIEQTTRRLVQKIGRQSIAAVVNSEMQPYPEREVTCSGCGHAITHVRWRPAQLRTLFGFMGDKRAYYLCPRCHQGCCHLDRRLAFLPNAMSAELEQLAAMTGVLLPFGIGRDLFETLTQMSLSERHWTRRPEPLVRQLCGVSKSG